MREIFKKYVGLLSFTTKTKKSNKIMDTTKTIQWCILYLKSYMTYFYHPNKKKRVKWLASCANASILAGLPLQITGQKFKWSPYTIKKKKRKNTKKDHRNFYLNFWLKLCPTQSPLKRNIIIIIKKSLFFFFFFFWKLRNTFNTHLYKKVAGHYFAISSTVTLPFC